ncbi:transmembrane and coiled-coil domain containing protein [Apis cerana cerana]|uniref:Transmembrane and coiled-coil domain containing protein n=1 Tax=Apis cerana cerana TaxID=94128 RepID=A0A2A3EPQ2_APICC|nr:transmembrane and coiled-coil domain containing protein [Apis cerana cerana]
MIHQLKDWVKALTLDILFSISHESRTEKGMDNLMITTSSKNSSRSTSPKRRNILISSQQLSATLEHIPKIRNVSLSQTGEDSTGSGSSGGEGSLSMKGSRQKSPGTVIRVDAMDESNTNLITAEQDEFVPNIHLPTDDDGINIFTDYI